MVKSIRLWAACLLLAATVSSGNLFAQRAKQELPQTLSVNVTNPLKQERQEVMVFIAESELRKTAPAFNPRAFVVLDGDTELASQFKPADAQNEAGIVVVLDALAPEAKRKLTIRYNKQGEVKHAYTKRTQAEISHKVGGEFQNRKYIGGDFKNVDYLRVPAEHTDHSYYIRYEGPGWESDKVGYRFYLDWRNGVDVFGKTTHDMVLQQVGLDGFDSYHELQPWGMDVLKVGKSLGVGSLAMFNNGTATRVDQTDSLVSQVVQNGDLYSSILTDYYGWQVANQKLDLHSLLSIHAGSRLTHQQVQIEDGKPSNLSTGLIKDERAELHSSKGDKGSWGYIATYGKQSLNGAGDNLGIAVLFRPQDLIGITEDANSHVVQLKPTKNKVEYYFLSAWELEPEGIKTEEQFLAYLRQTAQELANPVQVSVSKK